MVVNIVCLGAVFRAEGNWCGAAAEFCRASRAGADPLGAARPTNVEIRTPDQLKERPVHRFTYKKRSASRVGKTHFLCIDWRMLGLLGVGTLQFVAGRVPIPKVSAKERALRCIVFEHPESR